MTVYIEGLGKITAKPEVLNTISIMASEGAKWNEENGYYAHASNYDDIAHTIYEGLDKAGVYDAYRL